MSLRFRHLQLEAATEIGTFGLNLEFVDGLNVIAAPNTSGKSTAMMSILYALGLEGMLGASQQVPLTDAMVRSIMNEDQEVSVVESKVRLEIENQNNQRITVERSITGETIDRQLIRGLLGPALSTQG
ncbi:MAG: ATP-binding protein [Planctomycetota bacterium]